MSRTRTNAGRPASTANVAAFGALGAATNSARRQQAMIGQFDELLTAQDRTNQLLEWIGTMLHATLSDEQRAEVEAYQR